MKALVFKGPEKIFLEEIKKPIPKENELLIKIKAVGICGSDFEGYLGKTGRRIPPMIMGHELSGEIADAKNSNKFNHGDKVVVQPILYCGRCNYCKKGLVNLCKNWKSLGVLDVNGGMTEYIAVPERYIFKIKDKISFSRACLVEPLAVAYRATQKVSNSKLREAKFILVIGAGTIGLLILQVLKIKGCKNVIVSDISEHRLQIAKRLGADFIINPTERNFFSNIKAITINHLVDYSFEAVGLSITAAQSLEVLRSCGIAVWVGNAQKIIKINMQQLVTSENRVIGSRAYTEEDFLTSIKMIEEERVDLESIISSEESLENGVEAFVKLKKNRDGKIIKIILRND